MKKIIVLLVMTLLISCNKQSDSILNPGNKVILNEDATYIVYDGNNVKLDNDVIIFNNKTIKDYYFNGILNEAELLSDLNKQFPKPILSVEKNVAIDENKVYNLPFTISGDKKYIDSIGLETFLLVDLPGGIISDGQGADGGLMSTGPKTVKVLNANGIDGFASEVGEKLASTFGITYEAENYNQEEDFSYILNKSYTKEELEKIVDTLDIKYIKTGGKDDSMEADLILVTGKDGNNIFNIDVISSKDTTLGSLLSDYQVTTQKGDTYNNQKASSLASTTIFYNPEDYYTVYKMMKKISPQIKVELKEDSTLKNKAVILEK